MRRLSAALALVLAATVVSAEPAFAPPGPDHVPFKVAYKGLGWSHALFAIYLMPSEDAILGATPEGKNRPLVMEADGGVVEELGVNRWRFTAPAARRMCHVTITDPSSATTMKLSAFVQVPFSEMQGDTLHGYVIGKYPDPPAHSRANYEPPRGFVEVTAANQDTPIAPHFVLRQLLCKQAGGFPKYIVVQERLVLALEAIIERLYVLGHPARTLGFISGYRTPAYNTALKDAVFSRHQYGDGVDVNLDAAPQDGVIDDLDHDGSPGIGDAKVLYDIIDAMDIDGRGAPFGGGLGLYGPTASHPPFVHVDLRGYHARW